MSPLPQSLLFEVHPQLDLTVRTLRSRHHHKTVTATKGVDGDIELGMKQEVTTEVQGTWTQRARVHGADSPCRTPAIPHRGETRTPDSQLLPT